MEVVEKSADREEWVKSVVCDLSLRPSTRLIAAIIAYNAPAPCFGAKLPLLDAIMKETGSSGYATDQAIRELQSGGYINISLRFGESPSDHQGSTPA